MRALRHQTGATSSTLHGYPFPSLRMRSALTDILDADATLKDVASVVHDSGNLALGADGEPLGGLFLDVHHLLVKLDALMEEEEQEMRWGVL